ncbi:Ppx/GppA phosphatase family protein [Methylotenera sp.]|uniref:Ppx/GppA phosphatase family protein n=1 Tax=Methylotenera sp. TaxID=2051956 RepID=UPI002721F956|nr:Ppx/GppA phosphatase family protein [Methylotenera sp.]MDO9205958.1 Ppx/GppA phosphatase family protein [Methylotenera sp.]MDP1522260.1 Ppx/GppA phosphatase family protein [Methylotenera sp.]MDP2231172.1 Ppx/GppA phosphatase family protein [Methylotenera sp.]MDP3140507.1 Ppx/GppA phosphatase family protein [Methylotenera sp.]MDP3308502.1 Ppx/GppA phosphatase family protein [Methylotenera sp.]
MENLPNNLPPKPADKALLAAIDLGSNSFRLEIGRLDSGHIQRVEYLKEAVRQGGDLDEDRNLTAESIERGIRCLARFGERLQGFDASHVRAVATQTLREANNRDVFIKLAKKALGFDVEVISGVEEARLIYQGVSRFLPQSNDRRLVIDIGGRSTEFILGQGFTSHHTASLHVGSVAWSLKHFGTGDYTEKAFTRAEIAAESIFETLGANFSTKQWDVAYGASGTVSAVADVLVQYGRPADAVTKEGLHWLREELLRTRHVDKLRLLGLREDRKPVIAGGLSILIAIFDFLNIETLNVAQGALRHGLLYDMLARENDMVDLRNASVKRLARKFDVDETHAKTVADVAEKLFEKISEDIQFAQGERQLHSRKLYWAGLLHEIGCIVSPIDAHLHGAYILEHTEPAGFSQSELHCLSLLILGQKAKLKRLEADFTDRIFVMQLICLRLAVILCHARQMPNLRGFQLHYAKNNANNNANNTIRLTLPKTWPDKYPQSYYLLDEETLAWQKINWRYEIVNN